MPTTVQAEPPLTNAIPTRIESGLPLTGETGDVQAEGRARRHEFRMRRARQALPVGVLIGVFMGCVVSMARTDALEVIGLSVVLGALSLAAVSAAFGYLRRV